MRGNEKADSTHVRTSLANRLLNLIWVDHKWHSFCSNNAFTDSFWFTWSEPLFLSKVQVITFITTMFSTRLCSISVTEYIEYSHYRFLLYRWLSQWFLLRYINRLFCHIDIKLYITLAVVGIIFNSFWKKNEQILIPFQISRIRNSLLFCSDIDEYTLR